MTKEIIVGWICVLLIAVLVLPCLISAIFGNSEPESEPRRDMSQDVSDEEFLAACSVKDPQIALGVRQVISDCLGLDEHMIHPHNRLVQDLGAW